MIFSTRLTTVLKKAIFIHFAFLFWTHGTSFVRHAFLDKSQRLNCASQITMKSYLQESRSTILITCRFDLVKYSQERFANILSYDLFS